MPLGIGLWRAESGALTPVSELSFPLENRPEELLQADPAIFGEPLLVIGRQVPNAYSDVIDLLAVSADGTLHVLDLKKDRSPRDVVAQILNHGSWVRRLSGSQVLEIFNHQHDVAFEEAFAAHFGTSPPQELNRTHKLTVIISAVDPTSEQMVSYLKSGVGFPVSVVLFRYFYDAGRTYLARAWLLEGNATTDAADDGGHGSSREPWNGRDWYVSFGEEDGGRSWDDARRYGFISAGGGVWFSRTLRGLPGGAQVFAYIPQRGYVGVGRTRGEACRFSDAVVTIEGQQRKLSELPLVGSYRDIGDGESAEYVVPVDWISTRPREQAVRQKGLFANQNSACKLRNRFTLDTLYSAFSLDEANKQEGRGSPS